MSAAGKHGEASLRREPGTTDVFERLRCGLGGISPVALEWPANSGDKAPRAGESSVVAVRLEGRDSLLRDRQRILGRLRTGEQPRPGLLDLYAKVEATTVPSSRSVASFAEHCLGAGVVARSPEGVPEFAAELEAPLVVRVEERRRAAEQIHSRRVVDALERTHPRLAETPARVLAESLGMAVGRAKLGAQEISLLQVVPDDLVEARLAGAGAVERVGVALV
jgi:hypothetical protein